MAKVNAAIRSLPKETLFDILDRALVHVPADALSAVLGTVVPIKEVQEGPVAAKALLKAMKQFHKDTLDGVHFDSFDVNSKNWTDKSEGTEEWIAECKRLHESCVAQAPAGPPETVRVAFEFLFDLLRRIDKGEDIVFFADEAGSWQVEVDWDDVLPAYYGCLSQTATPHEYAKVVTGLVADFAGSDRASYIRPARKAATPEQGRALGRGR
jgi:hypothetical protein